MSVQILVMVFDSLTHLQQNCCENSKKMLSGLS
jgi:hypothetical protein